VAPLDKLPGRVTKLLGVTAGSRLIGADAIAPVGSAAGTNAGGAAGSDVEAPLRGAGAEAGAVDRG